MSALLFALLAVLVTGLGARDQLLVARLSAVHGPRGAVLAVAVGCAALTALIAASAPQWLMPKMTGNARQIYAALVLGLAGLEMAVSRRPKVLAEPTHSLFALGLVLLVRQMTDAARFLIFAITVATASPLAAGLGGAAGGAAVVAAGWLAGDDLSSRGWVPLRRMLGVLLLLIAVWLGFDARGRI